MPAGISPRSASVAAYLGSSNGNISSACIQLEAHPPSLVVRFKPKEMPKLNWADDNHLQADLGEVRAISPAIEHVASIRITLNYNGAVPSLD
jgi:hypothetical protein